MDLDALLADLQAEERQQAGMHTTDAPQSRVTSPAELDDAGREQWQTQLPQARDLDKQLRQQTRAAEAAGKISYAQEKKLFTERKSLRSLYAVLLSADMRLSAQHDVEQLLWKSCIYAQIASLRRQLRAATPTPTHRKYAEELQRYAKLHACTKLFLQQCMRQYEQMLRANLPRAGWEAVEPAGHSAAAASVSASFLQLRRLPDSSLPRTASRTASHRSAELRTLYLHSCHRCVIFLGDLERYSLLMLEDASAQRFLTEAREGVGASSPAPAPAAVEQQWRGVVHFYSLALQLLPGVGNPWNQIAVCNTYADEPLAAVHHYFRAISSDTPFPTAEVNAELLLEKLREGDILTTHAQQHEKQQHDSLLCPGTRVCSFVESASTETVWLLLFDLLFRRAHPHVESLSCVADAAARRLSEELQQSPSLEHTVECSRVLLSLLVCAQRSLHNSKDAASSQGHSASKDSMHDAADAPDAGMSSVHAVALSLCCHVVSTLISQAHAQAEHPSVAVVSTFLVWSQLHAEVLEHVSLSLRQRVFADVAQLLNSVVALLASPVRLAALPTKDDASADELNIQGCALLHAPADASLDVVSSSTPPSSASADSPLLGQPASAHDDVGDEQMHADAESVHVSTVERRCTRLLKLGEELAQRGVGLVRDHCGVFRSILDPAPAIALHSGSADIPAPAAPASVAASQSQQRAMPSSLQEEHAAAVAPDFPHAQAPIKASSASSSLSSKRKRPANAVDEPLRSAPPPPTRGGAIADAAASVAVPPFRWSATAKIAGADLAAAYSRVLFPSHCGAGASRVAAVAHAGTSVVR